MAWVGLSRIAYGNVPFEWDVSDPYGTITDEKGNIGIMETIDNTWTERLARVQTVEMGASALVSIYPATGKQLQDYGIHNIVTLSEEIGKVIRGTYADEQENAKH